MPPPTAPATGRARRLAGGTASKGRWEPGAPTILPHRAAACSAQRDHAVGNVGARRDDAAFRVPVGDLADLGLADASSSADNANEMPRLFIVPSPVRPVSTGPCEVLSRRRARSIGTAMKTRPPMARSRRSWLHPLEGGSLRQTRRGSVSPRTSFPQTRKSHAGRSASTDQVDRARYQVRTTSCASRVFATRAPRFA